MASLKRRRLLRCLTLLHRAKRKSKGALDSRRHCEDVIFGACDENKPLFLV